MNAIVNTPRDFADRPVKEVMLKEVTIKRGSF